MSKFEFPKSKVHMPLPEAVEVHCLDDRCLTF